MTHLQGTWHPVRAEFDGEPAPELALNPMELILTDGAYTISFGGEIHDRGSFTCTETTLVLIARHGSNAGRVVPAIYQLAGDRLRICYGMGGAEPTAFETKPGSHRYMVTYRRKA